MHADAWDVSRQLSRICFFEFRLGHVLHAARLYTSGSDASGCGMVVKMSSFIFRREWSIRLCVPIRKLRVRGPRIKLSSENSPDMRGEPALQQETIRKFQRCSLVATSTSKNLDQRQLCSLNRKFYINSRIFRDCL